MHASEIAPSGQRAFRFWLIASFAIALLAGIPHLLLTLAPHVVFQTALMRSWLLWANAFSIAWVGVVVVSLVVYRARALWMLLGAPLALFLLGQIALMLFMCAVYNRCI